MIWKKSRPIELGVARSQFAQAFPWFLRASAVFIVFLLYTALLVTGALNSSTVQVEQWLSQRPITRLDCTFYEWRHLGTAPFIACLLVVVGLICLRIGYRWPILPYLLLVLLFAVGCEILGKALFTQPIPQPVSGSISMLGCPQIHYQPASVRLSAATGMWWNVPPAPEWLSLRVQALSQLPLHAGEVSEIASYPGGHAMRWSLLGLLVCWLCWRHIKRPIIRIPLMLLALLAAIGGGFMQFYVGAHFITDTVAGYLVGTAAACCIIGILLLHEKRKTEQAILRTD